MTAFYTPGTMRVPMVEYIGRDAPRERYTEDYAILALLKEAMAQDASDIHINSGHPVLIEVHGSLRRLTNHALEWSEFENVARVLRDKAGATNKLTQSEDYDGSFSTTDFTGARRRLRVNMVALSSIRATQSGSLVLRPLNDTPPTLEQIDFPSELIDLCFPRDGCVYVIGPTGSGKTTLLAALVRHAAETGCAGQGHLAAYESPPEYDLEGLSSPHLLITQVAIHEAAGLKSFADGGRNAMRRHPRIMLLGEVRDFETISACVEAAQTGHPVLATTHASKPSIAFRRLVTRYPSDQQHAGMFDLILSTRLIIAQRLIPTVDGKRAAVREWLIIDEKTRSQLLACNGVNGVVAAMEQMVADGRTSFADSVQKLVDQGRVSKQSAAAFMA